jgi:hypothetical protein
MTSPENSRSPYLVSPAYDWAFFLLPPSLSLWLGIAISGSDLAQTSFHVGGVEVTAAGLFVGTLIHAHLVAVVFRSHANAAIFRLYPWRFIAVPLLLWAAIVGSTWVAVTATVVATFWDVWHSGAQTFGFCRIYDRNHGGPAEVGRNLDLWMNQLLYAGPILAGATLMDHVSAFSDYDSVGAALFTSIPAYVEGRQRTLTWLVLIGGTVFVAFYLLRYWRYRRQGYRVSPLKVYLLATTGLCSIYTWGFNTWGEAFFIMNLFHAVQYLALVWATEHRRLIGRFRLTGPRAKPIMATIFFGSVLGYGAGAEVLDPDIDTLWAVTMVVSLMHFWYDGFIWSVKKKQV